MDDLRARTTLFCGIVAFAIAASVLLRGRRGVHLLFAAFASCVAAWYTSQALAVLYQELFWVRSTAVLTAIMPQLAVHLFEAVLPPEASAPRISPLTKIATALGIPALLVVVSPYYEHPLALGFVYFYVLLLLAAALLRLWQRNKTNPSRAVRDRVRFLVWMGTASMTFTVADFIAYLGVYLPPIGAVLASVFLFVLAESLQSTRLAALYELVGRMLVSTALAFALAGIFYGTSTYIGRFGEMYLNAVIVAIIFLVLFDPLRSEVERRMHQFFFRERYDLETSVAALQQRLIHAIEVEEIGQVLIDGLEQSQRVTSAALYLRDLEGFELVQSFGPEPRRHLEELALRPLLETLEGSLLLEEITSEPGEADAPRVVAAQTLGVHARSVLLAIRMQTSDEAEIAGLLAVRDERLRDAFSPEEVAAFETLTATISVAITNTRQYTRLKERDRLATLGSMAAGLAHEVKNPLGAIKGAAQLLEELGASGTLEEHEEFLGIILEETNRLNRVVGSFLDYARPRSESRGPTDINAVVRRTVQITEKSEEAENIVLSLDLREDLPAAVIDAEQLRQVLLNLLQNAIQAMRGRGSVTVSTALRRRKGFRRAADVELEITVKDDGPGMSPKVLGNLFVPFFTTKQDGTGLGLAISQRIVQDAGGRIEVQSQPGAGTAFVIALPLFEELDAAELVTGPHSIGAATASSPSLARAASES